MSDPNSFILYERFRPTTFDECILPERIRSQIKGFIEKQNIPQMIFAGTAGLGKTSLAKVLCNELDADMLYINASLNTGIDAIRNQVVQFASTASFMGNLKIVILDECERLSESAQDSLKGVMEMFEKNTRFILTTNNKNKVIDPIMSRCTLFEFNPLKEEERELMVQVMKRVAAALKSDYIEFDAKAVATLVQKFYPDMRSIFNELQRYSVNGKIDSGILVSSGGTYESLVEALKAKKFAEFRGWIAKMPALDASGVFRYFFDNLTNLFQPSTIPQVILILNQYQVYASQVVDQELNLTAAMIELAGIAEWK